MPRKLKNLKIREISFVDKGASGDGTHTPRVAFWKRRPSQGSQDVLETEVIKRAFQAIVLRKMHLPEGAQALLDTIKNELSEEQWALLELMLANAAELGPLGASDSDGAEDPEPKPAEKSEDEPETDEPNPEEEEEGQDMPEKKPDELMAKIRKEQPALAAVLETFEKRAADAEAKNKDLAERLEKSEKKTAEEVQKRRLERFQKVAETDLRYLPGKPEDMAKRLADIEDAVGPEAFAAHLTMLKSASEAASKSMRPSGAPGSESSGAYEAIKAKARDLMKADASLTEAKAIAKVMKSPAERELVKRYREEQLG